MRVGARITGRVAPNRGRAQRTYFGSGPGAQSGEMKPSRHGVGSQKNRDYCSRCGQKRKACRCPAYDPLPIDDKAAGDGVMR